MSSNARDRAQCSDEYNDLIDGTHEEAQRAADAEEACLDEDIRTARLKQQVLLGRMPGTVSNDIAVLPANMDPEDMLLQFPDHPFSLAALCARELEARVERRAEALVTPVNRPGLLGSAENVKALRKMPPGLNLGKIIDDISAAEVVEDHHLVRFASVIGITVSHHQLNATLVSRYGFCTWGLTQELLVFVR
jgi:hypothetical protein